ncbi:hypothetical protein EA472_17920 [Natrarchaeobius oligotrophus]|uniref:Uncharacterized protein n=2 Tax=Natrarchaeobius TaxID=2501796 RepID=A0A3N6MQ14_NATCH|nr:hypothetical protein EA472_17920 [Natrarchaeobius chitinivorans]
MEYRTEVIEEPDYFRWRNFDPARASQTHLIKEEDTDEVLLYLEILLNTLWSNRNHSEEDLLKMDSKLRRVLREHRILFRLRPDHKYLHRSRVEGGVRKTRPRRYDPNRYEPLHFEKLADETIVQADQDLRVLTKGTKWKEPLSGYNEAWNKYQDGQFSAIIAEKLYNSVEAVVQKMCVEQGWENETQTVGTYLDRLNKEGLFEPNQSMVGEWQQIMGGLRTGVQKTGDRKSWHDEVDQDYCLLLLHQTSAFLTFLIKRYEKESE